MRRHHLDAFPIDAGIECIIHFVTVDGPRIYSPQKGLLFSLDSTSEIMKFVVSLKIDTEFMTLVF